MHLTDFLLIAKIFKVDPIALLQVMSQGKTHRNLRRGKQRGGVTAARGP